MSASALKFVVIPAAQAVHDCAFAKSQAAAEVFRLQKRLVQIEHRASTVRAERGRHQQQVTEALLSDADMPKALPPQAVEPDAALKIVKAELKNAELALVEATGRHRGAICDLLLHRRGEALSDYRDILRQFTERLRDLAALDAIAIKAGLDRALPVTIVSRLSIPALPRDPTVSPGLALDGRNFVASPLLAERERALRVSLESEIGCPLPF